MSRCVSALVVAALLSVGCHRPRDVSPSGQATVTAAVVPDQSANVADLVTRVSPAVVNITATQEVRVPPGFVDPFDFFFGGRGGGTPRSQDEVVKRRGLGSGFIVDAAGHVVTNAHVVENAKTVRVTLADEREFDATVRGRDARLDVAVLELTGAKDLPHATLGQSEPLRVGEYVVAIGNPFGLGNTVTMGIVSAKGRAIGAGPYDDFIQTDASINPGNSGGPVFNLRGEVVGISTAIVAGAQGIGFATPIDAAKEIIPQLLDKGFVARGRLGVGVQEIDAALAKALGLPSAKGALVSQVEPGSPAEKAGLKVGDLIVGIEGTEIDHAHELPRLVARRAPGTKVTVDVKSKGAPARKVTVTLDQLPADEARAETAPKTPPAPADQGYGMALADTPGKTGATVQGVVPGSQASESLQPGDTIVEVNGTRVTSAREAADRLRATPVGRPALLRVERDGSARFVALERRR